MTGTPRSFASTPQAGARRLRRARRDAARGAADRIGVSQCLLLGAVRRHQPQAVRRRHADGASAPCQRVSPDCCGPLHDRDRDRRAPGRCRAGDILLLPFADAHKFWNGELRRMAFGPDLMRPGPVKGLWTIDHGGGGDEDPHGVRLYRVRRNFCSRRCFAPCRRCWSTAPATTRSAQLITSTVTRDPDAHGRRRAGQRAHARPADGIVVRRGAAALRRAASRPARKAGSRHSTIRSSAARCSPFTPSPRAAGRWTISRARPAPRARCWPSASTPCWARRRSNMSPAGACRLAADRIRNGHDSLAAIAADVGYEFEAAFNRAFKRVTGVTPGRWRDEANSE